MIYIYKYELCKKYTHIYAIVIGAWAETKNEKERDVNPENTLNDKNRYNITIKVKITLLHT